MADEQQSKPEATNQVEAAAGYMIPARRVTWLRIHLLIVLAAATATLAILLSVDPAGRPLWLLLLVVAIAICCLLLTYALGRAISGSARRPQSGSESPPA